MRDELMTREQAFEVLQEHFAGIVGSFEGGWQDWIDSAAAADRVGAAGPRSRASLVNEFITDRAETYFRGLHDVGITCTRDRGFLVVEFEAGLQLRFKKFRDDSLATSGILTAQRQEIEWQQVTLANGMTPTFITAGYVLDELELSLARIAIACPYGNELLWSIDLRDDVAAAVPLFVDEPVPPVVRSTRRRAEEQQEGSGS